MGWMRWTPGRQGTGYEKLLLLQSKLPIPFDLYLLRFRPGAYVSPHRDPVPQGTKHFRLNIFVRKAKDGGLFRILEGAALINWPRLQMFRPDVQTHYVTTVNQGTRYVLSIGWLIKEAKVCPCNTKR